MITELIKEKNNIRIIYNIDRVSCNKLDHKIYIITNLTIYRKKYFINS